mgnify:CR=1 FL=1
MNWSSNLQGEEEIEEGMEPSYFLSKLLVVAYIHLMQEGIGEALYM